MLRVGGLEWKESKKGVSEFEIPQRARVDLRVSGPEMVTVSVISQDGEILPCLHLPGGTNRRRFSVERGGGLRLSSAKDFVTRLDLRELQAEEPHDEREVPAKPVPDNLLARIRDRVRQDLGVLREEFLESGETEYQLGEEAPDWFEEELEAEAQKRAAEAASAQEPVSEEQLPLETPEEPAASGDATAP